MKFWGQPTVVGASETEDRTDEEQTRVKERGETGPANGRYGSVHKVASRLRGEEFSIFTTNADSSLDFNLPQGWEMFR
ncbi:unnamed protein product [Danaus chrysippus]|uniref:(African queen) hypothetical protein n=1 Tax=Danaus chrysippus TaxID=151541 RepID=A0A8J2R3H6_9NEOP|nr:unnamed protein product [Danaus chrysippus]